MTAPPDRRPARRTHAERSDATRAQLIAATIDVVRAQSFAGASMFEIAKAAGVTPGALQHHFGSKAGLMMRVLEHILDDTSGGVAWPPASLGAPERARAFVRALWKDVYEPPRFLVAWRIYFGSAEDDTIRAGVAAHRNRLARALRARFVAVFPELAGAPDLDAFTDLVFSCLRGLAVARLFDPMPRACARQLAALADLIAERCARSLAVPAAAVPAASRRRTSR